MEASVVIYTLGLTFIFCSLIKFLKIDHWVIRFFDFPQLQFLVLGMGVFGASFIWLDIHLYHNIFFLLVVTVVVLYQAKLVVPYTIIAKKEIKNANNKQRGDIKLLVSNVYQPNTDCNKLLNLINKENPDVLLLVETNNRWQEDLKVLESTFAYSLKKPLDNMYGLLFYSKLALRDAEIRYLVKDYIPSVKTKIVLKSGREIQFYGLHPEPPSPTENYRSTERDAELYLIAKEINKSPGVPTVVAGDLNEVAWSKSTRIFQKLSGLLDPRKGRGFYNTFHAKYPIKWPLDHFFVSDHFHLVSMQVHENIGSDHFPISIALNHVDVSLNEEIESADVGEREEAQRQIDKSKA